MTQRSADPPRDVLAMAAEMRRLAEAAKTRGPWFHEPLGNVTTVDGEVVVTTLNAWDDDLAYIAAVHPQAVLALLDALAAAREALTSYGQHARLCMAARYRGGECSCGWDATRAHLPQAAAEEGE